MSDKKQNAIPQTVPVQSSTFSQTVNAEIRRAAATGIYDIRGGGANATYRILMICCFWAHQFHATHWKAIVKNVKPRSHWEPDSRKIPLKLIFRSPLPV